MSRPILSPLCSGPLLKLAVEVAAEGVVTVRGEVLAVRMPEGMGRG